MRNLLTLTILVLNYSSLNASFPVDHKIVDRINYQAKLSQEAENEPDIYTKSHSYSNEYNTYSAAAFAGDDALEKLGLFIIWLTMGAFAGHRWFSDKPKKWSILFILTAGGLGLWWLIDGINIISGSFM